MKYYCKKHGIIAELDTTFRAVQLFPIFRSGRACKLCGDLVKPVVKVPHLPVSAVKSNGAINNRPGISIKHFFAMNEFERMAEQEPEKG